MTDNLESKLISEYGRDNFQQQVSYFERHGFTLDPNSHKATPVKNEKTGETYILHTGVVYKKK